jgi:hypothetical protein
MDSAGRMMWVNLNGGTPNALQATLLYASNCSLILSLIVSDQIIMLASLLATMTIAERLPLSGLIAPLMSYPRSTIHFFH